MNSISVSGRLGKDAELKTIGSGTEVLNFSVANDVGFGERKMTQWFSCAVFGKRATALSPYLKKGMNVTVIGEFKARPWESNGKSGTALEIVVDRLAMQSKVEQQNQSHEPSFDDNGEIPF